MKDQVNVKSSSDDGSSSPPLTSSLHSRHSASSAKESAYLHQASILRLLRLICSSIIVCIAVAIIGCTGHLLYYYNQTQLGPQWFISLWPADIDLKPTLGTIIPAAIVVLTGLLYIALAVIPSPRSRTLHQVLLFLSTSIVTFIATLFAVLFNQILLYTVDVDTRETLQTWTCKFYNGAREWEKNSNSLGIGLSGEPLVPAGFKRSCMESMAGQWMTVGLLILELVCCGVAVWGVVAEMRIKKSRETRYAGEKCESEF